VFTEHFLKDHVKNIGFEFFTVVTMKSSVYWDIIPCNPVKVGIVEENIASIFSVEE
jgi:hypothetical protein